VGRSPDLSDSDDLIRQRPRRVLDALKSRKARDTARSVIDQFTGGRAKPATPEEAAPAPANAPAAMGDVK
jgi:AsmA protein